MLDVSTSIEGDSSPPEIQKIEIALALVMMGALDGQPSVDLELFVAELQGPHV